MILTTPDDPLRRLLHDRDQLIPLARPEPVDVEQQPDPPFGLAENGDAGQLLKSIEGLTIGSDEDIQIRAFEVHVASGLVDPRRYVAVDIEGVQEALKEVASPLGVGLDHLRVDWFIPGGTSGPGGVRPLRCRRGRRRILSCGGCRSGRGRCGSSEARTTSFAVGGSR